MQEAPVLRDSVLGCPARVCPIRFAHSHQLVACAATPTPTITVPRIGHQASGTPASSIFARSYLETWGGKGRNAMRCGRRKKRDVYSKRSLHSVRDATPTPFLSSQRFRGCPSKGRTRKRPRHRCRHHPQVVAPERLATLVRPS